MGVSDCVMLGSGIASGKVPVLENLVGMIKSNVYRCACIFSVFFFIDSFFHVASPIPSPIKKKN